MGELCSLTPSWQSVLQQILRQTPIICATHNPTNVLELLHNKPAWLFDLVDECSLDNTTYVEEEDHYCLPFDVDSTFSWTFGTKAFSIQNSLLFFFRSSWKYQVSSSFFHPLNHIALLNFSQKVRVNVKSPVFLFIPQNTWHSLYNSFVSRPFFFESECSMALKHGESTSLNEGNQKPKHISSHPSHQQKSRSLIILACYKRNLTNCLQMCSLWVCLAVI